MLTRIVLIIIFVLAAAACGGDENGSGTASEREVIAAFYPLAFAADRIAGDTAAMRNLTPPGAEPHDVELSPRDVESIRSADVVLYLGGGFQPALEEAVDGARGETVDLLRGLELVQAAEGDHAHEEQAGHAEPTEEPEANESEEPDPHVWLDPLRFAEIAERIGTVLDRPEAGAALAEELRKLDLDFQQGLASCERRAIVTSHAAFGYLTRRYGLEQISIAGIAPEAEPTARELENIVHEVEQSGATTVFFETLISPRLAETIARETGADTDALNPLEGLTEDELDAGENYFTVMRDNLEALRRALGCR
jgi:zinc transport system substrate-binding protein